MKRVNCFDDDASCVWEQLRCSVARHSCAADCEKKPEEKKMKKILFSVMVVMLLALVPAVLAVNTVGNGIGIIVGTEDIAPVVWMCNNRILVDDPIEPGQNGVLLSERINNYAFEGESVEWEVVVLDKSGADTINDVYVTIGGIESQGEGNLIEANCNEIAAPTTWTACNARLDEEVFPAFDPEVMGAYLCRFTVESPESGMHGEFWVTVEADDGMNKGIYDENEFWFFNPELLLSMGADESLKFDEVRAGTAAYSQTILIGNSVEFGSGVLMDMFIAGTDFYDSSADPGAKCPRSNVLDLNPAAKAAFAPGSAFAIDYAAGVYTVDGMDTGLSYYATSGAYSTYNDCGTADAEGYVAIPYGDRIDQSNTIIDCTPYGPIGAQGARDISLGANGNILAPGSEMAITFRLVLPEPCQGNFDSGDIFFWGEAV